NIATPVGVNTGDGHKMALRVGGVMQKSEPHAAIIHPQAGARCYCFLHVNSLGERYSNEDKPSQSVCNSKALQPKGIAWSIFDSQYLDILPLTLARGGGIFWDQIDRYWGSDWDPRSEGARLARDLKDGLVVSAWSIEGL